MFLFAFRRNRRETGCVFQNWGLREDIWTEKGGRDRRMEKTA